MLFDASVLAHGVYHSAARSGIFFTSLNLLYQFRASGQFEIKLYCDPYFFLELQRFLKEEALRGIYFEIFSTESFLARCRANLILKKETALSYKKWFRFLFLKGFLQFVKILYYLFPAKIDSEKFSKELENTDIFFSPVYKIPEEVLKRKNIISAVLLYDLIAIKYPQFQPESRIKNWWLPQLLDCMKDDENTRYYCISEASKRDFLEYLPGFPSAVPTCFKSPSALTWGFRPSSRSCWQSIPSAPLQILKTIFLSFPRCRSISKVSWTLRK